MLFRVLKMGEICERSERATENKIKKRLGGNFKFSGCGYTNIDVMLLLFSALHLVRSAIARENRSALENEIQPGIMSILRVIAVLVNCKIKCL